MIKKGLFGSLVLVLIFCALSSGLGVGQGGLERSLSYVLYPVLVAQNALVSPFKRWHDKRAKKNALLPELERITRERDDLQKKVIELGSLLAHMRATSELRTYMARFSTESIQAPVLLRNSSGTQFVLVDAGEKAGVTQGMVALCKNVVVGKVTEVYPSHSKILLVSDPTCKVAAQCLTHGVKGIHTGYKAGVHRLEYVDHRDLVIPGDLVLTSGEGGVFPRGFALGYISHVDEETYNRTILVTPLIDYATLECVSLIPNTIHQETCKEL